MYKYFFKRILDLLLSTIGLVILSPVFIVVVLLLMINNGGKPFFYQKRPGKDENIFKVIKFKTMNDKIAKNGELLPDKERLTSVGKFIRKTSIDEIPQLINVFKGEMSLIGPRPLLPEYLALYNSEQRKRHNVKPGITGWAQINGRNTISWEKKFEYDVWYVDNLSFVLDIKILLNTFLKVVKSEDINTMGHATTEAFKGNNAE